MAQRVLTPEQTSERLTMTYEEFLEWGDEDTRAEWVDGEVIVFMPPKRRHAELVAFLFHLVGYFESRRNLGKSYVAPFEMLLREGRSSREPDIAVLLADHDDRITRDRIEGAADFVVEVVSPDSVTRDRRDKMREYAESGVREYLIVQGREGLRGVTLSWLREEGHFVEVAPDIDGLLWSDVLPGLWIDRRWFDADSMPDPFEVGDQMLKDNDGQNDR